VSAVGYIWPARATADRLARQLRAFIRRDRYGLTVTVQGRPRFYCSSEAQVVRFLTQVAHDTARA
jgi:hypothetical protein